MPGGCFVPMTLLFGIPAAAALTGGFLTLFTCIAFRKETDEQRVRYRTAYLIVMTGYFLVGWRRFTSGTRPMCFSCSFSAAAVGCLTMWQARTRLH